jgi:hypothetical protein
MCQWGPDGAKTDGDYWDGGSLLNRMVPTNSPSKSLFHDALVIVGTFCSECSMGMLWRGIRRHMHAGDDYLYRNRILYYDVV